ncbi:hypothetical protein RD792_006581 [Penstemon davidsonii]|uniref:D-isomer specific 2-hydroxyacid dehydrogenase NAD-binding domain-containing protein n=1 Tax=Penstemon davidsonii TaxID=160366 RepID=A0ABR0DC44_9LAMI|nr:hypothetical protein RD792_006581 [Penstemon davidsonii]
MDVADPLLCAGITVYAPMKDSNLIESPGKRIGIVGLGGLGHIAVKFGKAFGHHVTIISTSPNKEKEAKERLGKEKDSGLHFGYSFGPTLYWAYSKVNGTLVIVGAPEKPIDLPSHPLINGKRVVKGSMIGSIKETQDMMDVCRKHNITCDIEIVRTENINKALYRLIKNDVKYRFVLDIACESS